MNLFAYVPEKASLHESVVDTIDQNFGDENKYQLTYATDLDDLASMVSYTTPDVVLVFLGDKDIQNESIINTIARRELEAPVIFLAQNQDSKTLFNIASKGFGFAYGYDQEALNNKTLSLLVDNAVRIFGGVSNVANFGDLKIDFLNHFVFYNGQKIHLTGSEYKLLAHLITHKDKVCTKQSIYDSLYMHDDSVDLKIVDVFIFKLRKALNETHENLGNKHIVTDWGNGYRFISNINAGSVTAKKFGNLVIDADNHSVSINGKKLDLTINEFLVFNALANSYPNLVDKQNLIIEANKFGREADEATVDRLVASIGRKLAQQDSSYVNMITKIGKDKYTFDLTGIDQENAKKAKHKTVVFGPLTLNLTLQVAEVTNRGNLDLSPREFSILKAFVDTYPDMLTPQALAAKIDFKGQAQGLTVPIHSLNAKISEILGSGLIYNKRGYGYGLDIQDKKILSKFFNEADQDVIGPWIINHKLSNISFQRAKDNIVELTLSKPQFTLFSNILSAYPSALNHEDALRLVYGDDATGKDNSLKQILYQLLASIKSQVGDIQELPRKSRDGSFYRFDMPSESMNEEILDKCEIIDIGPWSVNITAHKFLFDGDEVRLTDSEFSFVKALAESYPSPLSKEDLAKKLNFDSEAGVGQLLFGLKRKLEDEYQITEALVLNRRKAGYILASPKDELAEHLIEQFDTASSGDIEFNLSLGQISHGIKVATLSPAEVFVLGVLNKANKPLSVSEITESAQGEYTDFTIRGALSSTLKAKCEEISGRDETPIRNISGLGYYLASREDILRQNANIQNVDSAFSINHSFHEISVGRRTVSLKPSEYAFIRTLAENTRVPQSVESLSHFLDEDGVPFSDQTLKIARSTIVRKLLDAGVQAREAKIISHMHDVGYYFTSQKDHLDQARTKGFVRFDCTNDNTLEIEGLTINRITSVVTFHGQRLEYVSGRQVELLFILAQQYGSTLNKQDIAKSFMDDDSADSIKKVELGIVSLRYMLNRSQMNLGTLMLPERKDGKVSLALKESDLNLPKESQQKPTGKKKPVSVRSLADLGRILKASPTGG